MPHLSDSNAAVLSKIMQAGSYPADSLDPKELERAEYLTERKLLREEATGHHIIGGGGFLAPLVVDDICYTITPAGEDALAEFEQKRHKEAKAERQQRFENKVSVAGVLVPLMTFFLGLVVEYQAGIVETVVSFIGLLLGGPPVS